MGGRGSCRAGASTRRDNWARSLGGAAHRLGGSLALPGLGPVCWCAWAPWPPRPPGGRGKEEAARSLGPGYLVSAGVSSTLPRSWLITSEGRIMSTSTRRHRTTRRGFLLGAAAGLGVGVPATWYLTRRFGS